MSVSNILVMKFGGTSMGSADRIRAAACLIQEQQANRPVAVVVSAMSKVTDLLLDTMKHAEGGDATGLSHNIEALRARHTQAAHELHLELTPEINSLLSEFENIVRGMLMLGERPARSVDEAVAIGERLSALLLSHHLEAEGIPAKAINAAEVVVTDAVFGNASPLMDPTAVKTSAVLKPLLAAGTIPVITGFNGATADGRCTTLGRGGSDFSASILSAALDAAELWIWTDVDGIMTADPRLVPDARVLSEVSFSEAAELAYNGAKVLHPELSPPLWKSTSLYGVRTVSLRKNREPESFQRFRVNRSPRSHFHEERRAPLAGTRKGRSLGGSRPGSRHGFSGARQRRGPFHLRLQLPAKLLFSGSCRRTGAHRRSSGSRPGAGTRPRLHTSH